MPRIPLKLEKGDVFGRLTIIRFAGKDHYGAYKWTCKCICGNIVFVQASKLKDGRVKSCGCLNREIAIKHLFKARENSIKARRKVENV